MPDPTRNQAAPEMSDWQVPDIDDWQEYTELVFPTMF